MSQSMRWGDMVPLSSNESESILRSLEDWTTPTIEAIRNIILEARMIVPAWHQKDRNGLADESQLFSAMPEAFEKAVQAGRLFDLGYLPNTVIGSDGGRGADLYAAGHIGHPFQQPYCIFHSWEGGGSLYLVDPFDFHGKFGSRVPEESFLICEAQAMKSFAKGTLIVGDLGFIAVDAVKKGYNGVIVPSALRQAAAENGAPPDAISLQKGMVNLADPVFAALLLLATDGVAVDRIPAPAKLNKARAQHKKPLIPAHWKVHARDYVTALQTRGKRHGPDQGGHHLSPVPHLRRGHIRHKAAYHGGGTVWVRDAVVNLKDGKEESVHLGRSFYQQREAAERRP